MSTRLSTIVEEHPDLGYGTIRRGDDSAARKIIVDLPHLDEIANGPAIDPESIVVVFKKRKMTLREHVWVNVLGRDLPADHCVIVKNGFINDVRESNLDMVDIERGKKMRTVPPPAPERRKVVLLSSDSEFSIIARGCNGQRLLVDKNADIPALCIEDNCVRLNNSPGLLREYIWSSYASGTVSNEAGVVVPLNYCAFDVRSSNLVKVKGIAHARSFSPPEHIDVPADIREHLPDSWEFVPFGLKYCFDNRKRHIFSVSKMV